ncbi:hypothetical protein MJH12_15130, partial [bacterium]|nr:hypothetical protein [bacterium]
MMFNNHFIKLIVIYLLIVSSSFGGPIHSNSAFAPYEGDKIIRQMFQFTKVSHDPTNLDRKLTISTLKSVYIYGLNEKMSALISMPYFQKKITMNSAQGRITRKNKGYGDIQTVFKYRFKTIDEKGRSQRYAFFTGMEWPTAKAFKEDSLGSFPKSIRLGSNSYDPMFGFVYTDQSLDREIDFDLVYKVNHD